MKRYAKKLFFFSLKVVTSLWVSHSVLPSNLSVEIPKVWALGAVGCL